MDFELQREVRTQARCVLAALARPRLVAGYQVLP
jgi:hypothetical protein